jgi:DhnA family fructose-bisphosphate aldolase class Ia
VVDLRDGSDGRGVISPPAPIDLAGLTATRVDDPSAIARAWERRPRRPMTGADGRLLIVAADHSARGALSAGDVTNAMADRAEVLRRLSLALANPAVDGVLAAPDLLDDLVLCGLLDDRLAIGSINRAGLPGTVFEIDDRLTGTTAASAVAAGLDGAKLLLRIDRDDPATAGALERAAAWVSEFAAARVPVIVEPFFSQRSGGNLVNDLRTQAVLESAVIAAALGDTSAYTWLKLPVVKDFSTVARATSQPIVLLGGEVEDDVAEQHRTWGEALSEPTVRGLMVGRSLLFPSDGSVVGAVAAAAALLGR